MADEASRLGLQIMTGCMVATSLAMAPAVLVAQRAKVVDLDGPLLLAKDRPDGLRYDGSLVHPADPGAVGIEHDLERRTISRSTRAAMRDDARGACRAEPIRNRRDPDDHAVHARLAGRRGGAAAGAASFGRTSGRA